MNPKTDQSGFLVPEPKAGSRKTLLSASYASLLIRRVNSLLKLRVERGERDSFIVTDSNAVLTLRSYLQQSAGGSGNLNWRGLYSSSNEYAVNDVVYSVPVLGLTMTWVCETANGSASAKAPVWPHPGTVYWRLVGSSGLGTFRVNTVYADYLECHAWTGSAETGSAVNIAKCAELRNPASETIDSTSISYSYTSTVEREATADAYTETQKIIPRIIANASIIYASPTTVPIGATTYYWLDANPQGREWSWVS